MLEQHLSFMRTSIKLAKYALDHGETPVACIFVNSKTNEIISFGINNTNDSLTGIAHAEFIAIDKILKRFGNNSFTSALFNDIIVYVTVEPCIMCASALKQLGIKKIYFGCPNERFGGNGTVFSINTDKSTIGYNCNNEMATKLNDKVTHEEMVVCNNKEVNQPSIPGLYRKEAIMLLRYFYHKENINSPKPRSKQNRTLDKGNFPNINWEQYITKDSFEREFGNENALNYYEQEDICQCRDINWTLLDGKYNDLINKLNNTILGIQVQDTKRIKLDN